MADRLHVLTVLYQSERADRSTTLTVSLATMGAAVTYLIGTIAFFDKLDLLGWGIALLPFPLVCVAAFHSMLINVAAVRARSILHLERALLDSLDASGPDHQAIDRGVVGVTASEHRTNLHTAPRAQRGAILIAYGGVGVIYVGYLVLMLWRAAHHLSGWIAVPAVGYAALLLVIGISWRAGAVNMDFRTGPTS